MPSIADVYVTVLPETSRVADGIMRAFREVDPKATEAGRRWGREIQRGMDDVKVELKADTAKAKSEIEAAAKDKKATVEVKADTAKARAEVDEAARDRHSTVHLNVDKDRLQQSLQSGVQDGLSQMGSRLSGSAASSGASIGTSMGGPMQAALMAAGITALAGIASAASGMLGLIPAGLAGAGSVIGALAVGLDGVKDAWDAAGKAAESSGKDQESKAKAVADATKSLKDAVIDEAQAQKDVANARKDARQQLEDLNVQLRGGVIDEKQAVLDAAAARRDLATGRFKDAIDYQQAQLRVQQADQRVLESHERQVQLQKKASEANAQGVEGSDRVVAANQRLEKANDSVAAAQRNLADAQKKTSSEADAAAKAMAKLSPAAAAFVGTLVQMKPLWEGFKNSVQDALFANMGPQIRQLATTYMPMLQGSFTALAGLINQGASALMKFLEQPATMSMIQGMLSNITESFRQFLPVMQTMGTTFLQMSATGSAFLPQLGQIIGQMATMFAGFVNSGQFAKWMETGLITLQQLTNMLPTVLKLFADLAPIGNAALGAIGQVLAAIEPAIGPLSQAFAAWLTAATPMLTLVAQLASTIVSSLAPAFTQFYTAMAPIAQELANAFLPVLQTLAPVLAEVGRIMLTAFAGAIRELAPHLVGLVRATAGWFQAMLPLLPSLMQLATTALPPIVAVLTVLLPLLTRLITAFTTIANTVVPPLSQAFNTFADAYTRVFSTIEHITETVYNKIKPILDWLENKFAKFEKFLSPIARIASMLGGDDPGKDGLASLNAPGGLQPIGKNPPGAGLPGTTALPGVPGFGSVPGVGGAMTAAAQPRATGGWAGAPSGFNWDAVAQAESGGNWANRDTGHNGHYGGLQFSPATWAAYGGAGNPADASREEQIKIANRVAFTGWNGKPPQGLGAWETITKGMVPGVTTSSTPQGAGVSGTPGLTGVTMPGLPSASGAGSISSGDAALLANVPAGKYVQTQAADLAKGIGDCSSAVEDLINMMDGVTTAGRGMSTANAPQWLTQHGFLPTNTLVPGAFNVGFNDHHMQATLPGGTPFNWGSDEAAGQRGIGGTGAFDPSFTQHYYRPAGAGAFPSAGMPTAALPGGVSPDGIPLGSQQSPMYVMPASSGAEQFGQDFLGGFLEIFGFDGNLMKSPLNSGLFKGFKGIMSMLTGGGQGGGGGYPASAFGGDGAALPPLGGSEGGLSGLLAAIMPQPSAPLAADGPQAAVPGFGPPVKTVGPPQSAPPVASIGPTFNINQSGMFLDKAQAQAQIKQAAYTGTGWHPSMTNPALS